MLDLFKPIFGSRSFLGVDIGTTSIKIVEIGKSKRKPKLKNYGILESYGHLERLNDAIQTSALKIMDRETAEFLNFLLKKSKFKTREAIASLPSFIAFITLLEIPQMVQEDTAKTIQFQIRQHIPLPPSEVAIDWLKVGEREDEKGFVKQQILLISVANEQINKYQNIFKLAGLNLRALEVESLSLIRSLMDFGDPTPTLIVDIGSRSTNIAVVEQGFLKYNYQSDFAGTSLTQTISSGLGVNIKRAEELKKQKGLLAQAGEYELSTLTFPLLDAIISEVKRAKSHYEKHYQATIEKAILAGGGANLLGIEKYFEEQLGLKTVIGNPFSKIEYPAAIEPMTKELGPPFAVAIGLGIREFV
jgi:type IV pilus assembly protein PilM